MRWSVYGHFRRHTPEVGAVCGKAARTVLCGGRAMKRTSLPLQGVMSHIGTNLPIRGTHASNMRKSIIGHEHHPIRRLLASRMGFPVGTGLSSVTSGLSG